jgi:hypothetical protein
MIWTPILVLIEHKNIATIRKLHPVLFQDIPQTVQKEKKKHSMLYTLSILHNHKCRISTLSKDRKHDNKLLTLGLWVAFLFAIMHMTISWSQRAGTTNEVAASTAERWLGARHSTSKLILRRCSSTKLLAAGQDTQITSVYLTLIEGNDLKIHGGKRSESNQTCIESTSSWTHPWSSKFFSLDHNNTKLVNLTNDIAEFNPESAQNQEGAYDAVP